MHPLLKNHVANNTVANTLLFVGPRGSGKKRAALELAARMMGSPHAKKLEKGIHPDFQIFVPVGKSGLHPMEIIRTFTNDSALPPYEAPCRFFVIEEAHRMLPTSSNALLKTLEEPSLNSYFILLSTEPQSLLPTVVSRCQRFDFAKETVEREFDPLLLEILDPKLSYPQLLQSLEKLEKEVEKEEDATEKKQRLDDLFDQILCFLRDREVSPSLNKLFSCLEGCELAFGRSMKLSVVLEYLLLKLSLSE